MSEDEDDDYLAVRPSYRAGQPVVPGWTLPVPKMPAAAPMPVGGGQDRIYRSSAGTGFAAATPNERNRVSDTAFPIAW